MKPPLRALIYGLAGPFIGFESFNLILAALSLAKGSPLAPALAFLTNVFKVFAIDGVWMVVVVSMLAAAIAGLLSRGAEAEDGRSWFKRCAFGVGAYLLMILMPAWQSWNFIRTPVGVLLAGACTVISMAACGSLCRVIERSRRRSSVAEVFA